MAVSVKADHLIDIDDIIDVHSRKKCHVHGPLKLQSRSPPGLPGRYADM
jgi:hypothetical protein